MFDLKIKAKNSSKSLNKILLNRKSTTTIEKLNKILEEQKLILKKGN